MDSSQASRLEVSEGTRVHTGCIESRVHITPPPGCERPPRSSVCSGGDRAIRTDPYECLKCVWTTRERAVEVSTWGNEGYDLLENHAFERAAVSALSNRTVQLRRFGGPENLEVVRAPLPTARRGEVRVHVLASGLEYTDVPIRRHLYPQTSARRPPFVMGYDVVGEIDQIGEGVSGFRLGEHVADMTVLGSNADYRSRAQRRRPNQACRGKAGGHPIALACGRLSRLVAWNLRKHRRR